MTLASAAVAALALGGCVSAHKLDQALAIPVGMNEVQVANKVGQPVIKDRQDDGTERWVWSRKGQFGPESVTLVMKDGRVAAVESEGERLKHLEELQQLDRMEAVLVERARDVSTEQEAVEERAALVRREGRKPTARREATNAVATTIEATDRIIPFRHEKSSEQIWREQEQALAEAQRQARNIEEQTRALVEKAREEAANAIRTKEAAKTRDEEQEVPSFTAWYMARQFVSEKLAPKRRLFPNPRFATEAAGEERIEGNQWRAWGYVDTVDSSNAPTRRQWTVTLEFQGGTQWKLKDLAFGDK